MWIDMVRKRYSTLLIDLDDTIWDFRTNAAVALREMYDELAVSRYFPSFDEFHLIYKEHNHYLWDLYSKGLVTKEFLSLDRFLKPLRDVGCDDSALAAEMGDFFLHRCAMKTGLVEGAIEVLDYLKPKYRMAIASNGFSEVQHSKLERSGLLPYFSDVFLSESIGYQKPDKRFFDAVLDGMGVGGDEMLMIGDNYQTDILGAAGAGIDAVFFNRDSQKIDNPHYMCEISNLVQLIDFL